MLTKKQLSLTEVLSPFEDIIPDDPEYLLSLVWTELMMTISMLLSPSLIMLTDKALSNSRVGSLPLVGISLIRVKSVDV